MKITEYLTRPRLRAWNLLKREFNRILSESPQLAACPFCGERHFMTVDRSWIFFHQARCLGCGACGSRERLLFTAIRRWNDASSRAGVRHAAIQLADFIGRNSGQTADWPMSIEFDDEQTAAEWCERLNFLRAKCRRG
jgi:ferredoxin-like protein FixX